MGGGHGKPTHTPILINSQHIIYLVMDSKKCTKCGVEKPRSQFYNHKNTRDGLDCWCKTCSYENSRRWAVTPSGVYTRLKSRTKHYAKTQSYKAKPFNMERQEFIEWYNAHPRTCIYCEIPEKDLGLIKDGHNNTPFLTVDCKDNESGYNLENIVLCCYRCNSLKSNVFTFEEMKIIGRVFIKPKWEKLKYR